MNENFEKLGLSQNLLDTIKEIGFYKPTEIQEKVIPIALKETDIIGESATGSGKTLAFAVPIIQNIKPNENVQALILTPTRELAEQVSNSFKKFSKNKKLNILTIYGGVSINNQIRSLSTADIIIGTPGRIIDHLNRNTLRLNNIKYLVLDEVDRMFDMGFQNDVEKIIYKCPKNRQTMLFSATISSEIDYLSKKHTKNPVKISVESYVDHSQLKQIYYDVPNHLKFSLLMHLLKNEEAELVMVFCSSRRNVDFVAKNLQKQGIYANPIHGGMSQNVRKRMLENFHNNKVDVLVCTDVAARGLDIKGVSHVYNYDLPKTSDEYIHRIGRTARAGKNGIAINLLSDRDYENFSKIQMDENLKIEGVKLPQIEKVEVKKEFSSGRRKDQRGRNRYENRSLSRRKNSGERNQGDSGSFNNRNRKGLRGHRTNNRNSKSQSGFRRNRFSNRR